jgi:hypothetical protein
MRSAYRPNISTLIIIVMLASLIAFPLIGNWISTNGFGFREIAIGFFVIAGAILFLMGDRGVYFGFLFWILLFVLGFRSIYITPNLPIHPLVIVITIMMIWVLTRELIIRRQSVKWMMPRALYVMLLFWLWGWIEALLNGRRLDVAVSESLNVLMLIPVFVVTGRILENRRYWRSIVFALLSAGTVVAVEGIVEYIFPSVGTKLSAVDSATLLSASVASGGQFVRATFSIWGTPLATFICVLTIPLSWPAWVWASTRFKRLVVLLSLVIQLVGVYIGGYRSLWLMLVVVFMALPLFRKGIVGAILGLLGSLFLYLTIPTSGQERFQSLLAAFQGNFQDFSSLDRWQRASNALGLTIAHPEGIGWSGAGWVHSDFVQTAANLGIIAGLLFVLWYLSRLWAIARLYRQNLGDPLAIGLLGSFIVVGGMLALEGVQVLAQVALPVWFAWAMVEVKLRESQTEPEVD